MEIPQKIKNRKGYLPNIMKTLMQKDTCTSMFIAALFMVVKTWKEADRGVVAYAYNGILFGHKKE